MGTVSEPGTARLEHIIQDNSMDKVKKNPSEIIWGL